MVSIIKKKIIITIQVKILLQENINTHFAKINKLIKILKLKKSKNINLHQYLQILI